MRPDRLRAARTRQDRARIAVAGHRAAVSTCETLKTQIDRSGCVSCGSVCESAARELRITLEGLEELLAAAGADIERLEE